MHKSLIVSLALGSSVALAAPTLQDGFAGELLRRAGAPLFGVKRALTRLADGTSMQSGIVSSTLRWQSSGELTYDNCPPAVKIATCYEMHLDATGDLQKRDEDSVPMPFLDLALDPFQIGQFADLANGTFEQAMLEPDTFEDDEEDDERLWRRQTVSCRLTSDCGGVSLPANSHSYCDQTSSTCTFKCNANYTEIDGACQRSCKLTADCAGQKIPANSNQYCDQSASACTYRCQSGFTLNPWTKQCQQNGQTASPTTSSAAAPTLASQVAQLRPCTTTSQCAGQSLPDNARDYCNPSSKTCTFLCNSGYTLNPWTKVCQKNVGTTTTSKSTASPTGGSAGGSRPCATTSQCAGQEVPANSHDYCDPGKKICTFLCDSGYTLNPWTKQCNKNGVTTTRPSSTTTKATTTTTATTREAPSSSIASTTSSSSTTFASSSSSSAATPSSTTVTCALTVDCTEAGTVVPANANRWCNSNLGVCSWRCQSGYSQVGQTCVRVSPSPSPTSAGLSAVTPPASSSIVLTATKTTTTTTAASSSTLTPRQRIEMLSWPPASAGTKFNYQWKSYLASPVSSGNQFFHIMQLLRRIDGGAYVIALSIKNSKVYIEDIIRGCSSSTGNCPSVPLSTILDRTLQHNATVTWGTNGSFEYTVTDVLYNTTVLSYSAKGYMGDQSSLKYGIYRAYVPGMTPLTNYVGDHYAAQLPAA